MEPRISIVTLGVRDLRRAIRFCRDGLGFPTDAKDDAAIAFFRTQGCRLALYPLDRLAADVSPDTATPAPGFSGVTLAHNVREKEQVADVLERARQAGGRIVKPAQDVFWAGHSGYFSDPDGHLWEVAWGPMFSFDEHGTLLWEDEA